MANYSLIQWLFSFFIYCMVGWIWECTYVSISEKRIVNRGFMRGPVIPIYGCGAVIMMFATLPFRENIFLTFVSGMVAATLLEYVTGVAMEAIFKVRYWDYSDKKFNFQGHIWLISSIGWGIGAVLLVNILHRPVDWLIGTIPSKIMKYCVDIASLIFIADLSLSVKTALDIKDVLIKMEAIKTELSRMGRRIDIILAFAEDEKKQYIEYGHERLEDIFESLEHKIALVKTRIDIPDDLKEEVIVLKGKVLFVKEKMSQLTGVKDFFRKDMLKGNPGMISSKFNDSLEDLKKYFFKK